MIGAALPLPPATFKQSGHHACRRKETNLTALLTGAEGQGGCQVSFAGSAVADEKHVFTLIHIATTHQLVDQGLIDRRLNLELKAIQRLKHRKLGRLASN